MSKALETYFSGLTDLQKAALERIVGYQKELLEHGIHVRGSMELEFMTRDQNGKPVNNQLALTPFNWSLQKALGEDAKYLEKFDYESRGGMGLINRQTPLVAAQYEINIAEPVESGKVYDVRQSHPEIIAAVTDLIRTRTLQETLDSETNLASVGGVTKAPIYADFSPRPFRGQDFSQSPEHEKFDEVTSALHVNVSLYDKYNRNLFALAPDLMDHCTRALIELQHDAALPMLPTEASLWRIGSNNSAPLGLGVSSGNNLDDHPKDSHGSRKISVRMIKEPGYYKHRPIATDKTRIENRLPGADADPLVSMAITLAALVDAVRQHVDFTKRMPVDGEGQSLPFRVAPAQSVDRLAYDLPNIEEDPSAHRKIIDQYKKADRIRTLLGDKLYDGILHEYAPQEVALAR